MLCVRVGALALGGRAMADAPASEKTRGLGRTVLPTRSSTQPEDPRWSARAPRSKSPATSSSTAPGSWPCTSGGSARRSSRALRWCEHAALGRLFRPGVGPATPSRAERLGCHERRQQYAAVVLVCVSRRGDPRDRGGECRTAPRAHEHGHGTSQSTSNRIMPTRRGTAYPSRETCAQGGDDVGPQGSHPPVHKVPLGEALRRWAPGRRPRGCLPRHGVPIR
jgi:hypothetical protein